MDSPLGTRHITTFRNDAMQAPIMKENADRIKPIASPQYMLFDSISNLDLLPRLKTRERLNIGLVQLGQL